MNLRNIIALLAITGFLTACGEPITFKNIPFDQPNVKDALQKICQEEKVSYDLNSKIDRCKFKDKVPIFIVNYGALTDATAIFELSEQDALLSVQMSGSKSEMLAQATLLTEKYGKPSKTTEQVTNGFGTKFDQEIFTWTDRSGTRIVIESIYTKVDQGRLTIDSATAVKTKASAEKAGLEAAKNRL